MSDEISKLAWAGSRRGNGPRSYLLRPIAATILAMLVFAFDTFTTFAGAVAVLYCLVPLVASEGRPRSTILWSGGGSVALAFASFVRNHGLSTDVAPDFRFLFSVAAILTTTSLLLRNAKSQQAQRAQADEIARMRGELDRALRTATIAEISATIAHEVNQPLAAIVTNAAAARRWVTREPPSIDEAVLALGGVIDAADRAGQVVKKVRQLFDRGSSEQAPISVDEMVDDTMRLVGREIAENGARLLLDLGADGATVFASRLLLQQTIINLTVNALHAMGTMPVADRKLAIKTRLARGSIIIEISDSGPGFPQDIIERSLDAFFSTQQGGMGLGLAICRSTVLSIGGDVQFSNDSKLGGAIATLTLPAED